MFHRKNKKAAILPHLAGMGGHFKKTLNTSNVRNISHMLKLKSIRAAIRQLRKGVFATPEYPKADPGFRRRVRAPLCVR